MCYYNRIVRNPKYTPNKKNGGVVPYAEDTRVLSVPIGCGKCEECRRKKANEWFVRLENEYRTEKKKCKFITLTFSQKSLDKFIELANKEIEDKEDTRYGRDIRNVACKIAVRKWLERVRAARNRKGIKEEVRHWFITELGGGHSKRIHMHGFIWDDRGDVMKHWKDGWIYEGSFMSAKAITYTTKYMLKINKREPEFYPKIMASAGIGKAWINTIDAERAKYKQGETLEEYIDRQGNKRGLPIYYRNKLYSDEEKEKLWIEKLDKGERWIGKTCIKRKDYKTDQEFENACIEKQAENRRESKKLGNVEMHSYNIEGYRADLRKLRKTKEDYATKLNKEQQIIEDEEYNREYNKNRWKEWDIEAKDFLSEKSFMGLRPYTPLQNNDTEYNDRTKVKEKLKGSIATKEKRNILYSDELREKELCKILEVPF